MSAPAQSLRLVSSNSLIYDHGTPPGYATLSHRWLSDLQCRTTVSNVKEFRARIPFAIVPPHFRDAILLTKSLGVRFIWIDSLCYVQEGDDGADWNREASKMASIYRGADFNISVDMKRVSRGFLPINLAEIRPCPIPAIPGQYAVRKMPYNSRALDLGGLERRGWILQERLLARRAIHCTPWGLIWECCNSYEGLQTRAYEGFQRYSFERNALRLMLQHVEGDNAISSDISKMSEERREQCFYLFNAWCSIVERYPQRKLTVTTDKLIAVAGVARQISLASRCSITYLSGIWTEDLAHQLSWYVDRESQVERPSTTTLMSQVDPQLGRPWKGWGAYRAPSFSLASVDHEIAFSPRSDTHPSHHRHDLTRKDTFFELLGYEAQNRSDDPFNVPISANIRLKGPCIDRSVYKTCIWNVPDFAEDDEAGHCGILVMDDETQSEIFELDSLPSHAVVLLLSIFPAFTGMVLLPSGDDQGVYQRVGLWTLEHGESNRRPFNFDLWKERIVTVV